MSDEAEEYDKMTPVSTPFAPPETLSGLIRLALGDLRKCEQDPRYKVDMFEWHRPLNAGGQEVCHVCFAGATMAQSCGLGFDKNWENISFDDNWDSAHHTLNMLRQFKFEDALFEARDVDGLGDKVQAYVGGDSGSRAEKYGTNSQPYIRRGKELADDIRVRLAKQGLVFGDYDSDPENFHAIMEVVAQVFEEVGL